MGGWNNLGESLAQLLIEAEKSPAAKEAEKQGLVHIAYGNWAKEKGGPVVAKTKNGKLVPVSGDDIGAEKTAKKPDERGAQRAEPPTEEKPKVREPKTGPPKPDVKPPQPDVEQVRAAAQTQVAKLAKKFPGGPKGQMVSDMAKVVENPSTKNVNTFIKQYGIKTNVAGNKMYDGGSNSFKTSAAAVMKLISSKAMVPVRDWNMLAKPNHIYSTSKVVKATAIENGVQIGEQKITRVPDFKVEDVEAALVKKGVDPREAKFRAADLVGAALKYNDKIETFQRIGEVEVADYSDFPGNTDAEQIGSAVLASLQTAMKRGEVSPDANTKKAFALIQKLSQSTDLKEFEARYVELYSFVDADKGPASIRPSLPLLAEQFEAMYQTINGKQALIPMDEEFPTADIISLSTELPKLDSVEDLAALDDQIDFIFATAVSVKLKAGGASSSSEKIKQTKFDSERVAKDCERLAGIVPDTHKPKGHHPSDFAPDEILNWKSGRGPHSKVGKELLGTIKRNRKDIMSYYRLPPDTSIEQIFDVLSGGQRPRMGKGEEYSTPLPPAKWFARPEFNSKTPTGAWTTTSWQMHNVSGFILEAIHNRHVSRQSYTNVSYTNKGIDRTDGVRKLNAMKFQPYKTIEHQKTLGTVVPDGGMVSHIVSSNRENMQTAFTHKQRNEMRENLNGPGEKKKSGGLARGGRVSQPRNRQRGGADNRAFGGAGAGVQGPEPMAKSGEPNKKEDELEKDYLEMDDEPLQPQSPLGKLVAQEFDQPIGPPKGEEPDENEDELGDEKTVEETHRNKSSRQGRSKARGGKRQVRIDRQAAKRKPVEEAGGKKPTRARLVFSARPKDSKYHIQVYKLKIGKHDVLSVPRMGGELVITGPDGNEKSIQYPTVSAARSAANEFYIRQDIREDYQGAEQSVTDADGNELEVDEDAFRTAQKTEPTEVQQMDEPFIVHTKEGPAEGKAGDYLAKGVDGEEWPIDKAIFDKTHEFVDPGMQNDPGTASDAVRPPQNEVKGLVAPDFEMEKEMDEATATKSRKMTPARAQVINRYNEDPQFRSQLDRAWGAWRGNGSPAEKQKAGKFLKGLGLIEAMREAMKSSGGAPRSMKRTSGSTEWGRTKKTGKTSKSNLRRSATKRARRQGKDQASMMEGTILQVRPDLWAAKNQLDEVKHFTSKKIAEMFANSKRKDNFGVWPDSLRPRASLQEEPGGRWKSVARHFRPDDDENAKTVARGMVSVDESPDHLSSGGGTGTGSDRKSTYLGKSDLSPEEMKVIDTNWKQILKVADKVFKVKPLPVALRAIEKYLEKLGIDSSHSMKIGDILASQLNKDRDPVSMIIPKVIPKIQQEPYTKGSGYNAGGTGGMGPT